MGNRQCLNCRNYKPTKPANWKPAYQGEEFIGTLWQLHAAIGDNPEWNAGLPGKCLLQPCPVDVRSIHKCGQWAVNGQFLYSWEGLWAQHGLIEEIAKLKKDLKAAEKLSSERYHRIKRLTHPDTSGKAKPTPPAAQETVQFNQKGETNDV